MTENENALSVAAPEGAGWSWEEVKTARGTKSLGDVPILVWADHDAMVKFYGEEAILAVADGTSLRVSFQNIARRYALAEKSLDEIATAQCEFRPGKRAVGSSTPASRAAKMARNAVEKSSNKEAVEKLLAKIASGELSDEDLDALVS